MGWQYIFHSCFKSQIFSSLDIEKKSGLLQCSWNAEWIDDDSGTCIVILFDARLYLICSSLHLVCDVANNSDVLHSRTGGPGHVYIFR